MRSRLGRRVILRGDGGGSVWGRDFDHENDSGSGGGDEDGQKSNSVEN